MKYFCTILIALAFFSVQGQDTSLVKKNENRYDEVLKDTIYDMTKVEQQAEFEGGQPGLMKFMAKNIRYPEDCLTKEISGKILIEFVIDRNGKVMRANVLRGAFPSLDAEAIRVVNMLPKWKPAKHKGEKVMQRYVLPVNFKVR